MKLARDLMQKDVVTVRADAPVLEAYRLFSAEGIGGAPVVDDQGDVVGVISLRDLIRSAEEAHDEVEYERLYYEEDERFRSPEWLTDIQEFEDRLSQREVSEVMTAGVIHVGPEATVSEIATLLSKYRIHRVLVIDEAADGSLVGIISLFDLLPLLH